MDTLASEDMRADEIAEWPQERSAAADLVGEHGKNREISRSKALKSIRQTVRHWKLHQRSDKTLDDLARMFNNHIRGWINYYGRFYKSALYPALRHIDRISGRTDHRGAGGDRARSGAGPGGAHAYR